MRHTFLIALREYAENAKTKGFWISLFILPALIGMSFGVAALLARAEPSRHFVVVDQSAALAATIDQALEYAHQRLVLRALQRYVQQNLRHTQRQQIDLAAIPAVSSSALDQAAVEAFIARGGKDAYLAQVRQMLTDDAPAFKEPSRRFVRVELPEPIDAKASAAEILAGLKPYLVGERRLAAGRGKARLFAALLIEPGALQAAGGEAAIQYWSTNLNVDALPDLLRDALNDEARRRLYVERGVEVATVREIEAARVRVATFDPAKAEGQQTVSQADRIVRNAPVGFVYLLWVSIFTVMQMLLYNTIEEKSNRIAEVLLSSVTPSELMMGKLLGIAAIGLTMVGMWLATAFAALQLYRGPGAEVIGAVLDAVTASGLLPMFLLCFLFGYLIYAGLFLSVGALCNDIKEAQNLQAPMMMIMFVPFVTMVFINRDPHGMLATIMTWIPLYTPFTMMNRAAANPSLFELIGATLLMMVTALFLLRAAGRILRVALLRTGHRPPVAEILQWLRGVNA